jgi:hypothetical protein
MIRGESSEVFPFGSVAVAVTGWPGSIVNARFTSNSACPLPSGRDVLRAEIDQPLREVLGPRLAPGLA